MKENFRDPWRKSSRMWDFCRCSFHQHHDVTRGESWNEDLWLELDIFTGNSKMIKAKLSGPATGPSPGHQCTYIPEPFCTEESLGTKAVQSVCSTFSFLSFVFCGSLADHVVEMEVTRDGRYLDGFMVLSLLLSPNSYKIVMGGTRNLYYVKVLKL